MLTPELERTIRQRINPAHKDTLGTESHERATLLREIDRLRAELDTANALLGRTGYMCPACNHPVSSADKGCVYCELAQTKSESEWRRS